MSRRERMRQKVYPAHRSGLKTAALAMTVVSLLLIAVGLLGGRERTDGLQIEPSGAPSPTPVTRAFDESQDSRQITVPERLWYAIQLGVFEAEASAQAQAKTYRERGAAGFIWQDEGRYRVLAAVYPDREDAKTVRTRLKESQSIDSYVFEIAPVALTLRLSGMAGQLDVLEAMYAFWHESALSLQRLSVELDQREADEEQVRLQINGMLAQNDQLMELIAQRFTKPYHAAVAPAAAFMEQWADHLAQMAETAQISSVELGAQLKYETLWLIHQIRYYYEQLAQ